MGRFVRGMLLGLLMVFAVGVWPAHADVSSVSVSAPSGTIAGFYDEDGTAKSFADTPSGKATTSCGYGWSSIKFRITGPGDYDQTFSVSNPPGGAGEWTGGASSAWNTRGLLNGEYTVRLNATEQQRNNTLLDSRDDHCPGQTSSASKKVNVAGAPETPQWDGSPTPAAGGAAPVSLKWKKNPEEDIIAYEITRSGPDQTVLPPEPVPPSVCNGSTCQVQDGAFAGPYSGTYTYKIVAVRSAPAGTGEACGSARCVKSRSSDAKSVALTAPTPSPTPSPTGSPSKSPASTPGGGSSRGSDSTSRGTRVLSFGGGGGSNEFYSGTYDQNLPYQPKTLVLGGGQTAAPNGRQTEAAAFNDEPPNYRTIMLPVAGGLLAFLSAAHVRRLLLHF